jgi:CENP-B-like protein
MDAGDHRDRHPGGRAGAGARGRRPAIVPEKVEQIIAALEGGASKASVCRTFQVPRSTLTTS